jgi:chemotaxis protein methyltransferase CheR
MRPGDDGPALSDDDFARVQRFIKVRAGIELGDGKKSLVVSRLLQRLRREGVGSFRALLDRAEREEACAQALVNALTTNVTAFFREAHHFEVLVEFSRHHRRPLRVWSSACSSGEEPWSIAGALMTSGAPLAPDMVWATDIDSEVLERARAGIYPMDRLDAVPPAVRPTLLQRGTRTNQGLMRIAPVVRPLVRFSCLNLLGAWPRLEPFDVVFCRNVLIYFDPPTRRRVVERLVSTLAPGGLLLLGHSESLMAAGMGLTPCGKTAFRKPDDAWDRRAA